MTALRDYRRRSISSTMPKLKIFIAESVSSEDFYDRDCEGHVVEEIVQLLGAHAVYKIVIDREFLSKALLLAAKNRCDVFHLSCHGDSTGIELTDETDLSWKQLADMFQKADPMPRVLTLSSCLGGDNGLAKAFTKAKRRPDVIFGAEAEVDDNLLTFPSACISWSILYTGLVEGRISRKVFKDAVDKMNEITLHEFVYRRWDGNRYLRYPSATSS